MNYFFVILAIVFIIYVYLNVKDQELSIKESFFWMVGSIVMLFLSMFYKMVDKVAVLLGVWYPPSLVFLIAIMFLLFINFRNSKKIYKQNERIVELAQKLSILEFELNKKNEVIDEKCNENNEGLSTRR